MKYLKYDKKLDYSYILGAFPTLEAISNRPDLIEEIIVSSKYKKIDELKRTLGVRGIGYTVDDKLIARLSKKENVFVIGIFKKKLGGVLKDEDHLVLERVSNMGNLGTIIRTMVGLGMKNLVTIGNTCDIYNPKVIRASMGSFFKIRHTSYSNMGEYMKAHKENRDNFFFLLDKSATALSEVDLFEKRKISLIFGNEGSGLDRHYSEFGKSVFIEQTGDVDSLNLPVACALGIYQFKIGRNYGKRSNF